MEAGASLHRVETAMTAADAVQNRYAEALDAFVEKIRRDPYILAAILCGSLSHDVVWEKSDIDVLLVAQEGKGHEGSFSLVENDISIHAYVRTRSAFRQLIETSLQSSFMHSLLNHGRLLYTHDETLRDLFERRDHIGARDREVQLLQAATFVLPGLTKAEKWLHVKRDPHYAFLWIMKCVDGLATVETVLHGEVTGREVIQQGMHHNPEFFRAVYTDLIEGEKTWERVHAAVELIRGYLRERTPLLFKPVFEYLAESEGPRSASEIDFYFGKQLNLEFVSLACEWLADEGIITKLSLPRRLTPKSRVDVDEAAYYWESDA